MPRGNHITPEQLKRILKVAQEADMTLDMLSKRFSYCIGKARLWDIVHAAKIKMKRGWRE